MRPAQQGTFDGLCGVYAVINALDLVGVKRRRSALHSDLFIQLTHGLGAAALLRAMYEGLRPDDVVGAANVAFDWLFNRHGYHLEISQPFLRRQFDGVGGYLQALAKFVAAPDTAAIISFKKPGRSHWTVVQGLDGHTLQLRDSAKLTTLEVTGYSLDRGQLRLRPSSTLLIKRKS